MPIPVYTDQGRNNVDLKSIDLKYDYPDGLDLKPGSKLHDDLLNKIMLKARESASVISSRFDSWKEIDRTLTAYITTDDKEKALKNKDSRKPVSIVFPNSYVILETILSYMVSAFFQDPVFRYEGVSPEDTIGAIMMEKINQLHAIKNKALLNIHTFLRDSFSYGFGVVYPYWKIDRGDRAIKKETGFFSNVSQMFRKTGFEKTVEKDVVLFEGNALTNIDPYLCLPDTSVSITDIQSGEFFGWVEQTNIFKLLSEERSQGNYFNVKYLKKINARRTGIYSSDKSGRNDKTIKAAGRNNTSNSPVDIIHMMMEIIPFDEKLGDSKYPEKWFFSIGNDSIIIEARPIGLNHNKFNIAAISPDADGYSSVPVSRMEILYGLQNLGDFYINSHTANVRKAVNDMFIYDPYQVNSKDLTSPGEGKLIRLRRPAWGKGVKDVVQQLSVSDITRAHMGDLSYVTQGMNRIGGADESALMGSMRTGGPERLTKGEFQGTQRGAFSRLERIAKLISVQGMQDIGEFFASHTQQFINEEQYVKTSGRWQEVLMKEYGVNKLAKNRGRMKVSPLDLLINYDVVPHDGTVPGSNFSEVWVKMFEVIATAPELAQEFDLFRIFSHIARNSGAKNVEEFKKISIGSDEQVLKEADKGNIVPLERGSVG